MVQCEHKKTDTGRMSSTVESSQPKKERYVNSLRRHAYRQQQQELIDLLIQRLANRETQFTRLMDLNNFVMSEVITDEQRRTVEAWTQRQQSQPDSILNSIRQNYKNLGLIK